MKIPLFNLTLNIKDFNKNKLDDILEKFSLKIGKEDFKIKLVRHEKYWKFPEQEECIVEIYSKNYVSLKSILIKFDNLLWKYSCIENSFTYNSVNCLYWDEEAYWYSDLQKESFLHLDITWAIFNVLPIDRNICEVEELD
jgi:hypothetical protein